jgi:hypothetical protein
VCRTRSAKDSILFTLPVQLFFQIFCSVLFLTPPYPLQSSQLRWVKKFRFSCEIPRKLRVKARKNLKSCAKPHKKRTKTRFIPLFASDQSVSCIDQKRKSSEGFRREEDGRERGMRGFIG